MTRMPAFAARLALLRQDGWEIVSELEDPPYVRLRRRAAVPQPPAGYYHCELWVDDQRRVQVSAPGRSQTRRLA